MREDDLVVIAKELDILVGSGLFLDKVFEKIRFVTFDSENLFIFTRGQHFSTTSYVVKELLSGSAKGFHLFKIKHDGSIGKDEKDYQGGRAWFLRPELEETVSDQEKFFNMFGDPSLILDVVKITPPSRFIEINQDKWNYLTDVVFHEVGHIEHRRVIDWRPGRIKTEYFLTPDKEQEFKGLISDQFAKDHLDEESFSEMYPIMIDMEAAKRYCPEHLAKLRENLSEYKADSKHVIGRRLAWSLEETIPDFHTRKQKVIELLKN